MFGSSHVGGALDLWRGIIVVSVHVLGSSEDLCEDSAGVLSAYVRCSPSSLVWSGRSFMLKATLYEVKMVEVVKRDSDGCA